MRLSRGAAAVLILLGLLMGVAVGPARGESVTAPLERVVEEQLHASGAENLERLQRQLAPEVRDLVPEVRLRDLALRPSEALRFEAGSLVRGALRFFFREFVANARLLAQLVVLAVLLAVLQSLQGTLVDAGGQQVAFSACYLVLIILGVQSFRYAASVGRQAVAGMVAVMEATLPLLSTLLVSSGAPTTAAMLSPVAYGMMTALSALLDGVVVPLLLLSVVLGLTAQLSEKFPLGRLSDLARQATVTVLGLSFIGFLWVMAVKGVAAPVGDSVVLRSGKFLASTFVPVIGKMFGDAVEVVAGGALLVKSAVGLLGILLVAAYAFFPVLKITALVAVYKVAEALVEPVSDRRLIKALQHLEGSLTVLAVVVGAVGVMFFMGLSYLVGVGNAAAALR